MDAALRYIGLAVIASIMLASFTLQRLPADQALTVGVGVPGISSSGHLRD
jgi:hypothetical protein